MKIGIYNVNSGRSKEYIDIYLKILDFNGIEWKLLAYDQNFFSELKNIDYYIHRFIGTDHDICIARSILPVVENTLKIPCYPDHNTYWAYEDKIREYFLMKANQFPMINSHIFFDKNDALKWAKSCGLPLVFKLRAGAGSSNVLLVKKRSKMIRLIKRMFGKGINHNSIPDFSSLKYYNLYNFTKTVGIKILNRFGYDTGWPVWLKHKNYVLFQDFIPDNDFDTRITTIGNRAFAFRRLNRKKDFRSSGSGKIDYAIEKINTDCIKIALDTSRTLKFQTMAYDFLFDSDNKPVFCELSYTFNDKAIFNCPGYWDENLNFYEGHFWPQYFQIKDLINLKELKQPDLL